MNKIIITKRTHGYKAHLGSNPTVWGCGKFPNEAIGDLIRTYARAFNIQIKDV